MGLKKSKQQPDSTPPESSQPTTSDMPGLSRSERAVKKGDGSNILVRLSEVPGLHKALKSAAVQNEVSMNEVMVTLAISYVKEHGWDHLIRMEDMTGLGEDE